MPETMSAAERSELERLRQENAKLKAKTERKIRELRVSPKGALSAYGLGRFPISLYPEQWLVLLGAADEIRSFIEKNRARLNWKDSDA